MKMKKILSLILSFIGLFFLFYFSGCKDKNPDPDIVDGEGNIYQTITIGTQTWLKENLKTTKYLNGDAIPTTKIATVDIGTGATEKFQWSYLGNDSNTNLYGRLYTWHVANDRRGICPKGWHVPDEKEWNTLISYLGGENIAAVKLKESSALFWKESDAQATNESGFTAYPSGMRSYDGFFSEAGEKAAWWTAKSPDKDNAFYREIRYDDSSVLTKSESKNSALSVRCIKD